MYHFNDEVLDALETSLSPERMATYLNVSAGDREKALRLYTWNTAISAAFYGPLQGLEVVLRNALHRQLSAAYGESWYDEPACGLDARALVGVADAKQRVVQGGYRLDAPHIVAELPFGFWVSLLGRGGMGQDGRKRNYDMTLWRRALYRTFPNSRRSRADTHQPLDYLRTFRNRIAHHEPIFGRHLKADYRSILEVTGWICTRTADWISHHSRVDALLACDREGTDVRF